MKRIALNFAASTLVLGITTVGCVANGLGSLPASAMQRGDQQAARLYEQAGQAISRNDLQTAINLLEQAVGLAPRDAGYRMLLADAYVKSGRFQSAEAAYRDVLALDPGRTRASLSMALMLAANGRQRDAVAQLEQIEGQASASDVGLAYALAGLPQRAIEILEPAARSTAATPRVRQNLALAYALGGDWPRSRAVAAQDVSPAELTDRMSQWAALAQTNGSPAQVAAMLGVRPVNDPGFPVQLALAEPVQQPVQMAAADPVPAEIPMPTDARVAAPVAVAAVAPAQVEAPAPAPVAVAYAAAEPAPAIMASAPAPAPVEAPPQPVVYAAADPVPVPSPAPVVTADASADVPAIEAAELEQAEWGIQDNGSVQLPEQRPTEARDIPVRVQYAAAAESLVRPDPVAVPARSRISRSLSVASRVMSATPVASRRTAGGRFVVQIGAFSTPENAERAWQTAERRFGLRDEQPVTMTIDMNGRLLHRVAISGFDKRGDATQVCNSIKARGGECFVRGSEGDAAMRWASRYTARG